MPSFRYRMGELRFFFTFDLKCSYKSDNLSLQFYILVESFLFDKGNLPVVSQFSSLELTKYNGNLN